MPKITKHGGPSNAADAAPVEPVTDAAPVVEVDPALVAKPARHTRVHAGVARGSAKAGKAGKPS